jgi:hypothetical protein
MLERLRHALDCLELSAKALTAAGDDRNSAPTDAEAVERGVVDRQMAEREVLEAMEMHVLAWPQDGVNWLLLRPPNAPKGWKLGKRATSARTLGGISRRAITPRALYTRGAWRQRGPQNALPLRTGARSLIKLRTVTLLCPRPCSTATDFARFRILATLK